MKVKFTLEKTESQSIRQMLEDIPIDLCGYVDCPDLDNNPCDNCPMITLQHKWDEIHKRIENEILPILKNLEG